MSSRSGLVGCVALTVAAAIVCAGTVVSAPSASASVLLRTVIPFNTATGIGASPTSIAVDSAHHRAYVVNTDGDSVSVVDTVENTVVKVIPYGITDGIGRHPSAVALDETRSQAYVAAGGTVSVIDTVSGLVSKVISTTVTPADIAVDPARARAYLLDPFGGTVTVIDADSNTISHVIAHDSSHGIGDLPRSIAFDPLSGQAYVANYRSHSVSVIDAGTESVSSVIPLRPAENPKSVAVDSRLHKVYVLYESGTAIDVIDTLSNTVTGSISTTGATSAIAVDQSSHQAIISGMLGEGISVLDTTTDRVVKTIPTGATSGLATEVTAIAVDSATHHVYAANRHDTGGLFNTVAVLNLQATQSLVRLSGADRFTVSATVSFDGFNPGVPVVYIASGSTFPDALSGSALAGSQQGPVLLVQRSGIPDTVARELQRLKPRSIVVLGGTASVDPAVETNLKTYAPIVRRVTGADRYEVSAALSASNIATRAPVVYVASGEVFPDALSASAAAGSQNAPVLLVQRDAVPGAVATELARLKPGRIVLVGGTNTVSDDVARVLGGVAPTSRIAGADRFAVSAQVSASSFATGLDTVYVASGAVFPDALSGSPAAIVSGSPVLLVSAAGVPADVASELDRLKPKRIVVLGGTTTIPDAVLAELRTHL